MEISRRAFVALGATAAAAGILPFVSRTASAGTLPAEAWANRLVTAAKSQVGITLVYDPAYTRLGFPGGDVPRVKGVCTDVIVRAYRDGLGLDLQKLVHEDMTRAFSRYPRTWGLSRPDSNIDHRRVPNLRVFLARQGAELPIGMAGSDYRPGDIVTQKLPGNRPHILIVTDIAGADGSRPMMVHNIGWGTRMEDVLFDFEITGHYRYKG